MREFSSVRFFSFETEEKNKQVIYRPKGRSVYLKTVTSDLKMLPSTCGVGQIFKTSVTVFHYRVLPAAKKHRYILWAISTFSIAIFDSSYKPHIATSLPTYRLLSDAPWYSPAAQWRQTVEIINACKVLLEHGDAATTNYYFNRSYSKSTEN